MRADAIAGYSAIGYKVERDIDHIILEPSPVQVSGSARVIEGQDIGQQNPGNRCRLIRCVLTLWATCRKCLELLLENRQECLATCRGHRAQRGAHISRLE